MGGDRGPERAERGQWGQRQRWALTHPFSDCGTPWDPSCLFEPQFPLFLVCEMTAMEICLCRKRKQLTNSRALFRSSWLYFHKHVPLFLHKTQDCLVLGGTVSCQQG